MVSFQIFLYKICWPCGDKTKAEIFNFSQISIHLQVIPRCRRTEPISSASIQRTSQEMENRFSFAHHQSVQAETVRPAQLICLSVRPPVCCLNVSLLFLSHQMFFLDAKHLHCFRKDFQTRGMRGSCQRCLPPAESCDDKINLMRRYSRFYFTGFKLNPSLRGCRLQTLFSHCIFFFFRLSCRCHTI